MPKVIFVKKARKDYPNFGIKKGDSYYHWKFRYGGKHISKTPPKPSQLTQSEFLQQIYDIQERLEEITGESGEDLETQVSEIASELRDLASEQEDKLSNMPDQLQSAPTGEMLQNRADEVNSMADDLENIDFSVDVDDSYEEFTVISGKDECENCKEKARYKTADGELFCKEHLDEWLEEKKQEKQNRIEEILSEIQAVIYNGE